MKNLFSFFFVGILLLFAMLLVTCAKEYSYEGGPLAQYSIEGSPAECAPIILSGNYSAGVAVNESNQLQVTADVTSKGYYNISTIPVNRISFSADGNFTDTGKQVVTLAGIGIPASAGSFTVRKANGIVFGNSGIFSVLGEQKVVLYGSGTPSAAGNYKFVPAIIGPAPLGGNYCGFNVNVQ